MISGLRPVREFSTFQYAKAFCQASLRLYGAELLARSPCRASLTPLAYPQRDTSRYSVSTTGCRASPDHRKGPGISVDPVQCVLDTMEFLAAWLASHAEDPLEDSEGRTDLARSPSEAGVQVFADRVDGDGALADGGRHPLHRLLPRVAGREDPGHARLQRQRGPVEGPLPGCPEGGLRGLDRGGPLITER